MFLTLRQDIFQPFVLATSDVQEHPCPPKINGRSLVIEAVLRYYVPPGPTPLCARHVTNKSAFNTKVSALVISIMASGL